MSEKNSRAVHSVWVRLTPEERQKRLAWVRAQKVKREYEVFSLRIDEELKVEVAQMAKKKKCSATALITAYILSGLHEDTKALDKLAGPESLELVPLDTGQEHLAGVPGLTCLSPGLSPAQSPTSSLNSRPAPASSPPEEFPPSESDPDEH